LEVRLLIASVGTARARNSAASQQLRDVLGGLSGAEWSLNAFAHGPEENPLCRQ
jgi:hypothetical protein